MRDGSRAVRGRVQVSPERVKGPRLTAERIQADSGHPAGCPDCAESYYVIALDAAPPPVISPVVWDRRPRRSVSGAAAGGREVQRRRATQDGTAVPASRATGARAASLSRGAPEYRHALISAAVTGRIDVRQEHL